MPKETPGVMANTVATAINDAQRSQFKTFCIKLCAMMFGQASESSESIVFCTDNPSCKNALETGPDRINLLKSQTYIASHCLSSIRVYFSLFACNIICYFWHKRTKFKYDLFLKLLQAYITHSRAS